MSDHKATPLTEAQNVLLAEIAKATKDVSTGFMFCYPNEIMPIAAIGLIETNPGMKRQDEIATRATKKGLQHVALAQWEASKEQLAFWKEREMLLRKEVVDLFADPNKTKGTENVVLDDGCTLKVVKKQSFGIVKKDAAGNPLPRHEWIGKVEDALDKIEALGPQYALVADRLIKWEADVSVTEYNALAEMGEAGETIKAIISDVIEIKDGTPTVELKEPKAKK